MLGRNSYGVDLARMTTVKVEVGQTGIREGWEMMGAVTGGE